MIEPAADIARLASLLVVEQLDTDLYRSPASPHMSGRVFGGQVIAQALASAVGSVDPARQAHSLHAYFLRGGDYALPIIYRVIRDFDGGTFANRRVVAMQNGEPILNLAASFQRHEQGLSHRAAMPQVPGPDQAMPISHVMEERHGARSKPMAALMTAIDVRTSDDTLLERSQSMPTQHYWFRLPDALGAERARVALAFCSDFGLISTSLIPHGLQAFSKQVQLASLDHAIWFHEAPPLGEWLLYAMDSPWSDHGRGLSRGAVYDQAGRIIASMAQEGLIRRRPQG